MAAAPSASLEAFASHGDDATPRILPAEPYADDGEARVRLVAETKASLAVLDAELQGHGKRFFGGDDLAACTLAHWLGVLEEVAGVRLVAEGEYPALRRWAEQYTSHAVVRRSLPAGTSSSPSSLPTRRGTGPWSTQRCSRQE
ncbi:probable glutathione S-transferase [Miscanthus floridulus]|uniref:probable glutathione S-transferase n=1 Tax=Miscanthus floridulus TaxID=154761 RepID=UPI0034586538